MISQGVKRNERYRILLASAIAPMKVLSDHMLLAVFKDS